VQSSLRAGFLASLERHAERPALAIGRESWSYRELDRRARSIAATLDRGAQRGEGKLTAIFGHRHSSAMAGILGALYRGHGYVPLHPAFPAPRTREMLARSRASALVVDPTARGQLDGVLEGLDARLTILLPDGDVKELRERWPAHTILGAEDLEDPSACCLGDAGASDVAYLLFTSGSTGRPKGVMVAHRNVRAFLEVMSQRYGITEHDRLSNTFDLTFDLSVFDLFLAWEHGACVCVPTAEQKLFPKKYVDQHGLTLWFSVPSTAVLMSRLKMLAPGGLPTLRYALFCGEALPAELAARFAAAAPNAVLENLYGPTELTIACTLYRWDPARSPSECEQGVVPIGEPYPGMEARVVDESLRAVPRGEAGELLLGGAQTSLGYLDDPERTARAFVQLPGDPRLFYRTGDRARWSAGGLVYLGRADHQIKIQGYRVELGEVEAVLRDVSGAEVAIAIGWPRTAAGADGIVAFVGDPNGDAAKILEQAKARLPSYMQPQRVVLLAEFPLNANGKVDRAALASRLEAQP
jgi:amino acid adenylation domain-containing protein